MEFLKNHAHAAANFIHRGALGRDLPAVDHHAARVRLFQQAQGAQEHALSASGSADNGNTFPLLHGQIQAFQHLQGSKGLGQAFYFDQAHAAAPLLFALILSVRAKIPKTR